MRRSSVYIAAPYPERSAAIDLMQALSACNVLVTSRWLWEADALCDGDARKDLLDVAAADVLVAMNPQAWGEAGTGGRHVEFGYALALGKPIVLIGARTNIFHHLSDVCVVEDASEIAATVQRLVMYRTLTGAPITRANAIQQVVSEFRRAEAKHAPMHSPHEGYAVIREELDELWDEIKGDAGRSPDALMEAMQTAAMCLRYIVDLAPSE